MSVRGKITKLFAALVTLAVVAAMCVLLVACDPDKGGENTGGGDAIFTEGVTLAVLTEKLNSAESFTWSQYNSNADEHLGNETYVYKFAPRMMSFQSETTYFDDDKNSSLVANYETYTYVSGEYVYSAVRDYEGNIYAEKSLPDNIDEYFETNTSGMAEYFLEYITEKDGKIVFDEERLTATGESCVTGSGYIRLNGTSIEVGYKVNNNEGIVERRYVISDVNATTVTIPDYIKAAEKDAVLEEW